MRHDVIRLTMPAKAEYLILGRLALAGLGRAVEIDEDVLADLKLALTEACGNAVRHAYGDGQGLVRVAVGVAHDEITIRVEDDGSGVSSTASRGPAVRGPAVDGFTADEGGMGLEIIRAIADDLDVTSSAQGTVLELRKRQRGGVPTSG